MTQYINKAAVVEELERLYNLEYANTSDLSCGKKIILRHILLFLNTLEVKDVDLDSEIRRYRMGNPIIQHKEESLYDYMANVAKHFFELGLKTQKEEV